MIYNKLVRDKIPEIIEKQGKTVSFRVLQGGDLIKALKDKLVEETQELINAQTRAEIIQEMADVLEVLKVMRRLYDFSMYTAEMVQAEKEFNRGSFMKGYFLESVGDEK